VHHYAAFVDLCQVHNIPKKCAGGVFWEKFLIENENGFGWAQLPPKPFLISDYDNPPKPFPNHGKQNKNKLL
jgi:hypothetical protein